MKKIISYIIPCLFIFITGCNDFLEEASQDEIRPITVNDYKEIIYTEAHRVSSLESPDMEYLSLLTDELEPFKSWGWADKINGYANYYTWQSEIERCFDGELEHDQAWKHFYKNILACNIVINTIDDIEGKNNEKDDLLGEAYFWRAYAYLHLVNLYAKPYTNSNPAKDLGVPINTHHGVQDKEWNRNTIGEVYDLINEDIVHSIECFERAKIEKTIFRSNLASAALLASRIFLYQEDYQKVVLYADKCISNSNGLYNIVMEEPVVFLNPDNPEILLNYGKHDDHIGFHNTMMTKRGFKVSASLLSKYSDDDSRKSIFFDGWSKKQVKKSNYFELTSIYGKALRTAEAFLNKAEAYAKTNQPQLAEAALLELRENRLKEDPSIVLEEGQTLEQFIADERWRELCFEEQRWFDLRRTTRPRIEHTVAPFADSDELTYVLEKDDPGYVLPIPIEVMKFNTGMKNNIRPERPGTKS